jgi:NitT/TauT family transport system ATP-binding protein
VEEAVYMAHRALVFSPAPGRIVAELAVDAPLPRPVGFRTSETFRTSAEAVSRALEAASA